MSWLDKFFSKGYTTVQIAGVPLPAESVLNFVSGFTGVDSPSNGRTDVTATNPGATPWHNVPVAEKNGNYTIVSSDYHIVAITTSGTTITLPVSPSNGDSYRVTNATSGNISVAGNGHNFTTGAGPLTLVPGESREFIYSSNSSLWTIA